jgi:hypothetical protein
VAQVTEKTVSSRHLQHIMVSLTFLISGVEKSTTTTNDTIFHARFVSFVSASLSVCHFRLSVGGTATNTHSRPLPGTVELLPRTTVPSTLALRL